MMAPSFARTACDTRKATRSIEGVVDGIVDGRVAGDGGQKRSPDLDAPDAHPVVGRHQNAPGLVRDVERNHPLLAADSTQRSEGTLIAARKIRLLAELHDARKSARRPHIGARIVEERINDFGGRMRALQVARPRRLDERFPAGGCRVKEDDNARKADERDQQASQLLNEGEVPP
jgi:hypothetical protein